MTAEQHTITIHEKGLCNASIHFVHKYNIRNNIRNNSSSNSSSNRITTTSKGATRAMELCRTGGASRVRQFGVALHSHPSFAKSLSTLSAGIDWVDCNTAFRESKLPRPRASRNVYVSHTIMSCVRCGRVIMCTAFFLFCFFFRR